MFELSNVLSPLFSVSSWLPPECKPDFESQPEQLPAASNITLVLVKWFPPAVKVSSGTHGRLAGEGCFAAEQLVYKVCNTNLELGSTSSLRFEVTDLACRSRWRPVFRQLFCPLSTSLPPVLLQSSSSPPPVVRTNRIHFPTRCNGSLIRRRWRM